MLLYAKTDEEGLPDCWSYQMSGNQIEVRTLDLNCRFENIKKQLNDIAEKFFADAENSDGKQDSVATGTAIELRIAWLYVFKENGRG